MKSAFTPIGAGALVLLLGLLAPAFGQEKVSKRGGEEYIQMDLNGVSLESILEIVQRQTGKVFLFEERIRNIKVFLKGSPLIPKSALFSVFKSILEINGFAIIRTGEGPSEVIKILDRQRIKSQPTPTYSGKIDPRLLPKDEEMVTIVYHLRYAESRMAANSLRQVVNQQFGNILPIANVNVLVVTDLSPNMKRILRILRLLDTPREQVEWVVVPLKWADPEETASKLDKVLSVQRQYAQKLQIQIGPPPRIVPDKRTGSLVLQGTSSDIARIRTLLTHLDVPLDEEPSFVHIYKLRHSSAKGYENRAGMVDLVNAIINANPDISRSSGTSGPEAPPRGIPMPGGSAPVPLPSPRRPVLPRQSTTGTEKPKAVAIADEATNSLIIVAPHAYFLELRRIIDILDVRRPQVLIEMAIIEVSSTEGMDIGVELAAIERAAENSTRGFLATQFGLSNMVDSDGNPVSLESPGIPAGRQPIMGSGFVFGITRGSEIKIPLLLSLIGKQSDLTILSMPRILTNENEEAEIKALQQVPTNTVSSSSQIASQISGGFQFQDAGITLKITPHISENRSLWMEIEQKIEEFSGTESSLVGGIALPPSKTTREIKCTITVPNHRTVVLGGITSTISSKSVTKIPFLGDIPLLGQLFRYEKTSTTRRNLFIFITPHILSHEEFDDLGKISSAVLKEARQIGARTANIDRVYRRAFASAAALSSLPEGQSIQALTYRTWEDDEPEDE
jgi:general secretion pathway protein D